MGSDDDVEVERDDPLQGVVRLASSTPEAPLGGQLSDVLADPGARDQLIDLIDIAALIDRCVISTSYRLPDELAHSLRLSELGRKVAAAVAERRRRIKPNDLQTSVFLSVACSEGLLIDPEADIAVIREALTKEILDRRLLYPFVYGRELHDLAAERFPRKINLSARDSLNLLQDLPIGVFQNGTSAIGPFGCLRSEGRRQLVPDYNAPGYLCQDVTCTAIHAIRLSTSDTSISKARAAVSRYLEEQYASNIDENRRALREAGYQAYDVYRRRDSEAIFDTLADGLELEELRSVALTALRHEIRIPDRRNFMERSFDVTDQNVAKWCAELEFAEILHFLATLTDQVIASSVDHSVGDGTVQIGIGEIRTREVNRHDSSEFAEVGQYGLRWRAPEPSGYVASRMLGLLHHLYFESGVLEPEDLRYQLSLPDGLADSELLDSAVGTHTPELAVSRLVMTSRRAAQAAERFLGIDVTTNNQDERLARILWKLGVELPTKFVDIESSMSLLSELESAVADGATEEDVRGVISNLFASVETALQTGLVYCVWALTTDHFITSDGFRYDPSLSSETLGYIDANAPADDYPLKRDGKNTLAPLGSGYARLAAILEALVSDVHRRPVSDWPVECRLHVRPFAFESRVPYLNLTSQSQQSVVAALRSVSAFVQDATVLRVRNAGIHGNNIFPTVAEVGQVVRQFETFRAALGHEGLYPQTYRLLNVTVDHLGRQVAKLQSGELSVTLKSPTWTLAPKLPSQGPELVVLRCAEMAGCGPLRFGLKKRPGKRDYWAEWPVRWESVDATLGSDHAALRPEAAVGLAG